MIFSQIPLFCTRTISSGKKKRESKCLLYSCAFWNYTLQQDLLDSTYSFPSILILVSLAFKHGLKDGHCAEAFMIPETVTALDYIRKRGTFPVSGLHTA
jgi:hypothetical protein